MASPTARGPRVGRTNELSISLDRVALANSSATIAEGARLLEEQAGREALVAWLGAADDTTPAERKAIRAEWLGKPAPGKRSRRRATLDGGALVALASARPRRQASQARPKNPGGAR